MAPKLREEFLVFTRSFFGAYVSSKIHVFNPATFSDFAGHRASSYAILLTTVD